MTPASRATRPRLRLTTPVGGCICPHIRPASIWEQILTQRAYPPVPTTGYGWAGIDVCPALFTSPPPTVAGIGSRSIMGINAAIAVQFTAATNVFSLNGQIATPAAWTGNFTGGMYGVYHETDLWHTGTTNNSYGGFLATYNSSNGTCSVCVGLMAQSIGNFYGGTNVPITGNAAAIQAKSGVLANATHTNDFTIELLAPATGGTFPNGHIGIQIDDQTNGGALPYSSVYAFRAGNGNATPTGQIDIGANTLFVESTTSGNLTLLAPTGAYGAWQDRWPKVSGFGYLASSPCGTTKVFLGSDFTSANASGLQAITGLGCALPNLGGNASPVTSFQCSILYSQATPVAGDQFGVTYTTTTTNFNAWGMVATATGATTPFTTGSALAIAANTPTSVVTFQPANTGLNVAQVWGTLEPGAASGTLQLYVTNGTAADVIVVKRGSYCQFF
jgi:hypothetical protein